MQHTPPLCNKDISLGRSCASEGDIVYMDYQATTPIDPEVLSAMSEAWSGTFGNAGSVSHLYGWNAKKMVEVARKSVADVISANPKDIIFTSGATESNNMAIKGVANFYGRTGKNHIITLSTEHKCVLQSCRFLSLNGFNVTYIRPEKNGIVDISKIEAAINEQTALISVCAVHNEIGVIHDIGAIGLLAKRRGVLFHTDAAQAFGKIKLDVDAMNIDLMSISGHKIYGPKGIGALYVRRKPKVRIMPIFHGGGQERGLRSGTLPVPLICGLGVAADVAVKNFDRDNKHVEELGSILYKGLSSIPDVYLNGDKERRYQGNWNFSFAFVEGESLLMSIPEVAVSSGSACTSSTLEPSYVLQELGVRDELAHSSIRFGIGRFTKKEDVLYVVDKIKVAVEKLRQMSPLWEMKQEGVDMDKIEWSH